MKETLFSIGPVSIHSYGLMIAIGVLAALFVAEKRADKFDLEKEQIFSLTIWCLLGGLLGAKLLYFITIWKDVLQDPRVLLNVANGFVVYGGIIGGILTGFIFCKCKKLKFLAYFDLVMPSIALAQAFGRIGCFLAGCCYGKETDSVIGVVFKHSHYAPNNVKLIPTQLISSGLDFINFIILIMIAKKKKADGQIAGFYLLFYSVGRFVLEYFRGDVERGSVGAVSTSQFIAIFIAIAGIAIICLCGKKKDCQTE